MMGLVGAQCTGKSTLAEAFAAKGRVGFVRTDVAGILHSLGLDASTMQLDIGMRLSVQQQILERTIRDVYRGAPGNSITDRTPLDMLAYTIGDVGGRTLNPAQEVALLRYTNDCYTAVNQYFSVLVLVQPGIPIKERPGKAPASPGYMEHLNYIMRGAIHDYRLRKPTYYLARDRLDLESRVAAVDDVWSRIIEQTMLNRDVEVRERGVGAVLH